MSDSQAEAEIFPTEETQSPITPAKKKNGENGENTQSVDRTI
jgi:hypothetical protein